MKKEQEIKVRYKVIKNFKSHCVCRKEFMIGEEWNLYNMVSKKRALIEANVGLHKVKLSRALTNSVEL